MDFHDKPDKLISCEKSNYFALEPVRSGHVEQEEDECLKEQEPEEDNVHHFKHDMYKQMILQVNILISLI